MILVFGGQGQLGQELARAAAARGLTLRALGRAEADIADPRAVQAAIAAAAPDIAVNAAAYTKVDLAESHPQDAHRANVLGAAQVAEACRDAGVPLVHVSTDYVFDGRKPGAYVESDPVAPVSVYGRTKAEGEQAVRAGIPQHVILRTAWVYGEFGHNFLKTVLRLAATRDELRIVADQHGSPTSTRDIADAILAVHARRHDAQWGTYHFTGSGVTTWHGFASRIVAAQAPFTGREPRVTAITTAEYPTPAARPANSVLDCTRFAQAFGLRAPPWAERVDAATQALMRAEGQRHVA